MEIRINGKPRKNTSLKENEKRKKKRERKKKPGAHSLYRADLVPA